MEPKFKDVKEGDLFVRLLAGKIPSRVKVLKVKGQVLTCGLEKGMSEQEKEKLLQTAKLVGITPPINMIEPEWTFSATTGGEIDTELGWDGIHTGSFLTPIPESN